MVIFKRHGAPEERKSDEEVWAAKNES